MGWGGAEMSFILKKMDHASYHVSTIIYIQLFQLTLSDESSKPTSQDHNVVWVIVMAILVSVCQCWRDGKMGNSIMDICLHVLQEGNKNRNEFYCL